MTRPRPVGRGTRVVITEYDLPRPTIEPHDVIVDGDGIAWYSNFGEQTLGKLDPRTGAVTEFPMPELKPGFPTGALSVRFDRDQNLWFGMMYQGAIAKLDRKTEKLETFRQDRKSTRLNSSHVRISYAVFCLKKKKSPRRAAPSSFCPRFRPPF